MAAQDLDAYTHARIDRIRRVTNDVANELEGLVILCSTRYGPRDVTRPLLTPAETSEALARLARRLRAL